jgi:glycosyltransferase involved in cell wall biosynthesis
MKIVLATPLFPPEIGGPATYVKELAERLRDDHEVTVVAYATTSENIPGVRLITVSKRRPLPLRLLKFALVLFDAAKGADVIYAQNAVAAGLPAVLVGRLRRVPVVIKFVGDEAWERATLLRLTTKQLEDFLAHPHEATLKIKIILHLQGWVLRRAQAVTTPSKYLADAVIRTYRVAASRVTVNYNAAERTEIVPFAAAVVPHQIVVTARLVEWKGIDGVIRATAKLRSEFPDVRLLIAGDGPQEDALKALARDLGLDKHVIFLGRVSRAETWHLRKTSQVYVLNSTYEGLPHTVLTSFAAGIPTVATDIPGTNEAVYNEETGLLVEPGGDDALANAIARLFRNSMLRKRVTDGAQEILQNKFSWQAHIATLISILQSAGSHPRH